MTNQGPVPPSGYQDPYGNGQQQPTSQQQQASAQPTQPYEQPAAPTGQPQQPYQAQPGTWEQPSAQDRQSDPQAGAHAQAATQQQAPVPPEKPKRSSGISGIFKGGNFKTFLFGFLGAALACVVVLGVNALVNPSSSSVTIGSSGGTTITVQGDDATLAEVVAQKALPSVVSIDVYAEQTNVNPFSGTSTSTSSDDATSLGSGVILSSDGYILTNYHVIEDGSRFVVTANAEEYEAQVVGTDESSDLAVLKIEASDLTAIEIGSSADLVTGEWVMAVGSPFGLEQSVSTGIVSATSRSTIMSSSSSDGTSTVYANMIQTDAAINPGNSGGALVDSDGKLIGINTLIASESGSSSGVGFAIPVDYAVDIAQQIIDGKTPSHAQLGVTMATVDSQNAARYDLSVDSGAYINSVTSGSGADQAGLQSGDIIVKIDGDAVTSASDVMVAVRSHKVGDTIEVTYVRDGSEQTATVTLGSDA